MKKPKLRALNKLALLALCLLAVPYIYFAADSSVGLPSDYVEVYSRRSKQGDYMGMALN